MALFGSDVFSPREIAERVEEVGVAKTRLSIVSLIMLAMLAGAFIALGSLYYVVVASDPALGWAARRVLGGVVFSLGLLLVVVAGAELFTGNHLLAMAWADEVLADVAHRRARQPMIVSLRLVRRVHVCFNSGPS